VSLLADLAADLLATAAACLADTADRTPADSYTRHGTNHVPRAPDCDHLEVRIGQIAPSKAFPAPFNGVVDSCGDTGRSVTFVIHLRRKCYPRLQNPGTFPPGADLSEASLRLADDAEQLWCCVLGEYDAGNLFAHPFIPEMQLPLVPGSMVPFRQADVGGWDWPLTVGLDSCCVTAGGSGS
jgi:hypothetical protein